MTKWPVRNKHTEQHKHVEHQDATAIKEKVLTQVLRQKCTGEFAFYQSMDKALLIKKVRVTFCSWTQQLL